jgi:hypothetical protein
MHNTTGDPLEEHHGGANQMQRWVLGPFFSISATRYKLHTYLRAEPVQTQNILPYSCGQKFGHTLGR